MKYIAKAIREVGFVHEDSFEAFLKSNKVSYEKKINGDYSFYEYKRKDNQRVLVCCKFIVNQPDDFSEEIILIELEEKEQYNTDDVIRKIENM